MTAHYKQIFGENLSFIPFLFDLSSIHRLLFPFIIKFISSFFFFLCTFIYETDDFVFIWISSVISKLIASMAVQFGVWNQSSENVSV